MDRAKRDFVLKNAHLEDGNRYSEQSSVLCQATTFQSFAMHIQQALQILLDGQSLSSEQMRDVMLQIMAGKVTDAQLAGFLIALRCKGETVDEIAAAVTVMRELADAIQLNSENLIDTCGTGGDGANIFNVSTTCAFVVAAAGGRVAKHGNRSVSSRCGSADLLEAAGINLSMDAGQVVHCVNEIGVGFLFAPNYHGAMKFTRQVRQDLGVRTLFNLLGPLANPARTVNQLIGVFSQHWLEPLAYVLKQLGSQHVLVVNAEDGLDELSIATPSTVAELKQGEITIYSVCPEDFGFSSVPLSELVVDDVASSLAMVNSALNNQPGPARDIVCLNAGAAIYAANLTDTLAAGVRRAKQVIASGEAKAKLDALIQYSTQFTNDRS